MNNESLPCFSSHKHLVDAVVNAGDLNLLIIGTNSFCKPEPAIATMSVT